MRLVALFWLFVGSIYSQAATRNVTVLVNFEKPHSEVSIQALRQELAKLWEPTGIAVNVLLKSEVPVAPQFSELVVFEMKGSCSMSAAPVRLTEQGPLGLAYSTNGQILHFGEVQCDRVRRCLELITRGSHPEKHQAEFGVALGIVVAHEIYHMIAGTKEHTKDGLTKESLSAHELLGGALTVPDVVREALRRP